MQTLQQIAVLRHTIALWRAEKLSVALVPTMGNLHAGHLRLIKEAQHLVDKVVVSIFVNPLQFGPQEDFQQYPRTLTEDALKLNNMGVHLLFAPEVREMYPSKASLAMIDVPNMSQHLCGEFRPGHFSGVCMVVNKLFNIVQPDIALFGQKDYQQLSIIKQMVNDLSMPVEIIGVATVREADGLALSSRNQYLSKEERETAPSLYQQLTQLAEAIRKGESNYPELRANAMHNLSIAGFKPQYVAICRRSDLAYATADDKELVILAAAYLGQTRLIDNVIFDLFYTND